MHEHLQTQALEASINKTIDNFVQEFDVTYATIVGVLQIKAHQLIQEAGRKPDDDDDGEGDIPA